MTRLIDADALKKAINDNGCRHSHYFDIIDEIDNTPTVEYPFYQEAYQTGYEEGKNERPQGKKDIRKPYGWQFCSECGKVLEPQDKFCWFCGADFRETDNNVPTVKSPCNDCIELECEHHGVVCPHYRAKEADNEV